jgi:hypothetical protein
MLQWFLTDEQLVERIRRAQRYRRLFGVICIILGLVGIAFCAYWINALETKSLAVFHEIADPSNPTTHEVERSLDQTRFNMGFALGFISASGFAGACGLCAAGFVYALTRNRKSKLLLDRWDSKVAN